MQSSAKGLKNWQKAIIIVLLILVGFILTLVLTMPSGKKNNTSSKPKTAKVQKISLKQTLLASGTVQSSKTRSVISKTSGTLKKVFVKNGQYVKKGNLIAQIDDTQAIAKIESLKRQLSDLELQRESFQSQLQNFILESPQDGFVQNLSAQEGLLVTQGMQIMTIVDDSKMKMIVQLPAWCYGKVKKGQKVDVAISEITSTIEGTIEGIGNRLYKNQDNILGFDVKVLLPNRNGMLLEGTKASVVLNLSGGEKAIALGEGVLEAFSKKTVLSPVTGKIEQVFVENGQKVKSGQVLLRFSSEDIERQVKQLDLKIEDIEAQIEEAEKELKNFEVLSPIDGKVVDLNLQDGDIVTAGQVICSVFDPENLVITAYVEELDILKIRPGQKAEIKLDAVPSTKVKPVEGYVDEISEKAQSEDSISKFIVKIKFKNPGSVKFGMHADAEIILKLKKGALTVPVEAVHKENGKYYVYVYKEKPTGKSEKTKKTDEYGIGDSYYKNSEKRFVKVGVVTDKYVEITSGLKEGEEVVLPKFTSENKTKSLFE
ncbi:efflux transporter, RND family, MFP subunit [Caldicellulosiruptor obsidiansis OB47]|uniref:Efflux transporter, RND family, MFP subunit n=1 Tax=Caldicellulosiruptor obsidiansis (strain ATCC BAA-2073 / JCM 16842 / OB47) TaxID=608506 RepID=D9TH69_CALOO|nr:efflux RND transporter periplasmic adaptor subunit [Caldicellulosiruptor obsidiansis]ADL43466.1 efflux transporter, RND family, MFP subunit [Caldicellulosiruptor obsidiansis OB47]